MKPRVPVIILLAATCLLSSCATNPTASQPVPPQWLTELKAWIRIDDVPGVSGVLAENSLSPDVALNDNQATLLMTASSVGSRHVAEWLLAHGAKADASSILKDGSQFPEVGGCTPLLIACGKGHLDIARLLVERSADVNHSNAPGHTPLLVACAMGHLDTAQFLVEHGADLNHRDSHDTTPLLHAIRKDHQEVAEYLLAQGADIQAKSDAGADALNAAAENGNAALVRALLGKGAGDNPTNAAVALLRAATEGRTEVVSLLVQKGAPMDRQDEDGCTPLIKAALHGEADTVKVLCDAGADPTKRSRFGRTALDYAGGIPGTETLKTFKDVNDAVAKGMLQQDEVWWIVQRNAAAASPKYDRIIKLLEDSEKRFHEKPPAGNGK